MGRIKIVERGKHFRKWEEMASIMTPMLACAWLCEDSEETHPGKATFLQGEGVASRQEQGVGNFPAEGMGWRVGMRLDSAWCLCLSLKMDGMLIRVRGNTWTRARRWNITYSAHPVGLQVPIGFRWSQVVGEGDVLLAHSFCIS